MPRWTHASPQAGLARTLYNSTRESDEEVRLKKFAKDVRDEAEKYLAPSLFKTYTTLTREATDAEKRALKLEMERAELARTWHSKLVNGIANQRLVALMAFAYVVLPREFPATVLPHSGWAFPFASMLLFGCDGSLCAPGSISYLGWTLLAQRVANKLVLKLIG